MKSLIAVIVLLPISIWKWAWLQVWLTAEFFHINLGRFAPWIFGQMIGASKWHRILGVVLALLLTSPALAQESEIHRLHPGGAYIDTRQKYETKIIPEAELESYLNQGWEKVDVYTVYETRRDLQGYEIKGQTYPFNKAIVRRAK